MWRIYYKMRKAIIIYPNNEADEINLSLKNLSEEAKKLLGADHLGGLGLNHFNGEYKLTLFCDDDFERKQLEPNNMASLICCSGRYADRFQYDAYLCGPCIVLNEDGDDLKDLSGDEFADIYSRCVDMKEEDKGVRGILKTGGLAPDFVRRSYDQRE